MWVKNQIVPHKSLTHVMVTNDNNDHAHRFQLPDIVTFEPPVKCIFFIDSTQYYFPCVPCKTTASLHDFACDGGHHNSILVLVVLLATIINQV